MDIIQEDYDENASIICDEDMFENIKPHSLKDQNSVFNPNFQKT